MKIKTRESLRTIKTFDRAKMLGQKVKNGAGEVKEYGEELQNTRYESANEYAGNAVENTERRTARNVAYGAGKIGNWGLKETRKNLLKWRNRPKKFKVKVQQPKQLPAPKRPALPSAKTTIKTAQKGVKTAQQTAKAAAKTVKVTVKAGQRAVQAAKVAAKGRRKVCKGCGKSHCCRRKSYGSGSQGNCCGNCRRRLDCRCSHSPDLYDRTCGRIGVRHFCSKPG